MMWFCKHLLIGLLISPLVLANDMKGTFNEARGIGSAASGNAQQTLKSFSAKEINPNMGTPNEAKLYTGQDANPNLGTMGVQALGSTEIGKLMTESAVNNPADTISTDSDMIKRSDEIVSNAHYLTGGISGKQCIKQTLSKSSFTNHYCEKDQAINATCKKTMNVVWSGGKKVEDRPPLELSSKDFTITLGRYHDGYYSHGVSIPRTGYKLNFNFPEEGIITQFEIEYANKGVGFFGNYFNSNVIFEGKKYGEGRNSAIRRDNGYKFSQNVDISVKAQQKLELVLITSTGIKSGWIRGFDTAGAKIKIHYRAEVDTLNAKLEEHYTCSNKEMGNAIKISEQCTSGGGTRTFVKDGKSVQLKADCWEHTENYLVSEASDNECKRYDDNPNCTVGERECISSENGLCTRFRLKYQCQHTTKTEGVVCGDKFFCSDGSCSDLQDTKNADFGHAVSQLASLAQAGKDVSLDSQNLRAFTGRAMFCRKTGFGFSDCCKDSGWGHKAGLAQCNSEENMLGQAKEKKTAIYVGTFCDKKVLGKCIRRKSGYCVFDSKLARIVQYQGRSGQLGVGFGGAKNPDCRGVSVDELQQLDFNAMDYSDFYEELQNNTEIPNQNSIINYIKNDISQQLQQQ